MIPDDTAYRFPVRLLIGLASLACTAGTALAQSYPVGPVRMIVPFPAGGGVDSAGRILATRLTESYGRSFVIENRGGANGNIGTEVAAHIKAELVKWAKVIKQSGARID